jgi:L-threonylcarbamoyladenylate synthase
LTYTAKTSILRINSDAPEADVIAIAADAIRAGKLVAFPTETVYGLGANALDSAAIDRIYRAKQRPASDPVIAHIASMEQLEQLTLSPSDIVYRLADAFWAGPLTLVLKRAPHVPPNIATGMDTIAVRMPAHPVARALIEAAGCPIAAPSANTFTRPSATTAAHVLEDLAGRVDMILDGGATTIGLESTVVDLTGETPTVLRPGGITVDDLRSVILNITLKTQFTDTETSTSAPGQMLKHYSPRADVRLFSGEREAVLDAMLDMAHELCVEGKRVGVLICEEDHAHFDNDIEIVTLGKRDDLATISHNLFAGMRHLDALDVDTILAPDFGREGLGAAVWDRLRRAAEGQVIEV